MSASSPRRCETAWSAAGAAQVACPAAGRASARWAYEALIAQLRSEQTKGLGAESGFVFTSETGRPLGRERIAKRGVTRAAKQPGLGQ